MKMDRIGSFRWEDPFLLEDELTEEERMIRDTARSYAQGHLAPRVREAFQNEHTDRAIFTEMGELGLLGVTIPEEFGGTGAGYVSYGLVAREVDQAGEEARQGLAAACRSDEQHRPARFRRVHQSHLVRARRPPAAGEPPGERFRQCSHGALYGGPAPFRKGAAARLRSDRPREPRRLVACPPATVYPAAPPLRGRAASGDRACLRHP